MFLYAARKFNDVTVISVKVFLVADIAEKMRRYIYNYRSESLTTWRSGGWRSGNAHVSFRS